MVLSYRSQTWIRAFFGGIFAGVIFMYLGILVAMAVTTTTVEPASDDTAAATQNTCGGLGNYDCLNDGVFSPSTPSGTTDYLNFARDVEDYYVMAPISGVNTVSQIVAYVYHKENKNNMQVEVSLWDSTHTTQYGSTQLLTYTSSAVWAPATFSGLSMSSSQLSDMSVRVSCRRTGGGGPSTCDVFALYTNVTYTEQIDITVSSTSVQQDLKVGTTSAHVGGAFTIKENTSSRNVTSIKVTENGTVNAAANLDNIELWYDLDTTPADGYNCSSESFDGNEIQYGVTDTDGFSAADGSSTFSSTTGVTITTSQTMCVYPVLDVGTGAAYGQTLELEITAPQTDVVAGGSPVIQPATTIALGSTTILLDEDIKVTDFHWRNDVGDETGAGSVTLGSDNSDILQGSKATNYRLRYAVGNAGNTTSENRQYRLEYGTKISTCGAIGTWYDVADAGGDWDMVGSGSGLTEGADTTNIAEAIGGISPDPETNFLSTNGGQRETTSQTGDIALAQDQFVELEYAIIAAGTVSDGTTYCFRLTDAGATANVNNVVYPQFTIAADITVSVSGSQVSSVSIPTNNFYNGGQFAITDGTPSSVHEVSSVTITASSTANVQTDFDNIGLWYDLDETSADGYNCSSESFNGDEIQYGATNTVGFAGDGTSTFTDSVVASTTRSICLYVVYDVLSSASDGEQIEIRIADPSMDVVTDVGSVAPAGLVDISGVTTLTSPIVVQGNYHWRNNDNTEALATSATGGVQNTVYDEVARNSTIRLRMDVSNIGGESSGNYQYRLEWGQKLGSCSAISTWHDVDTANDEFTMVASQLVDNSDTTDVSQTLGGVNNQADNFDSTNGGQKESSSQTNNLDLAANNYAELEFSIQATASTSEGGSYCFRVTNAGTSLGASNYLQYPELNIKLATDFVVTRNVTTIGAGQTTASITEGNQYDLQLNDASRAFIRITNMAHTGAGPAATGNQVPNNVTAYISNPSNIASGITFTRAGTTDTTLIYWEVVEYIGAAGGENEIKVRSAGVSTYVTTNTTVTTGTISGIVDDTAVVPWITGQGSPDTSRFDYNTLLSTSAWNAAGDTATFTRNEAGGDAVNVSYAILEFTGDNWKIQRSEHTFASAGVPETDTSINAVVPTQTFLHTQKRSSVDTEASFGHEAYISGMSSITYLLDGNATTPTGQTAVSWVIENTQSTGNTMRVWRSSGNVPSSGTAPQIKYQNIGTTLEDLSIASIFGMGRVDGTARSFHEGLFGLRLLTSSTTQYEIWVGDPSYNTYYRSEVVEWPTAAAKLYQNYYGFYVDNDTLAPTDPWPAGPQNMDEVAEMTGNDGPIASGQSIRLRMTLHVTAAKLAQGADAFDLEYAERPSGTTCGGLAENFWLHLGEIGSTTAVWRGYDGSPNDGDQLPGVLLSVSDVAGTYEEENNTAVVPETTFVLDDIEYDWHIQDNGAKDKTDYCFRMTYADNQPLEGIDHYPVIRTVGYGPVLGDWKWFDDETNPTPTTQLAATNSAPIDIANDNIIKLRAVIEERSGATGEDAKFKVQFSESPNFSTVFDVVASSTCEGNSLWCYADAAGTDNATITATTIYSADSCVGGVGAGCGTYNEGTSTANATLDHQALGKTEFEFTLQNAGARVSTVYYFRLYDIVNDEVVTASTSNPSLVTEGGSLSFTMSEVAAGQSTEGIVTDVTTTADSIPFGSLAFDGEIEAAYRLTMNTNATEGYQIYMYSTGPLINTYGTEIAAIGGTNAAPVSWTHPALGCLSSATGCFAYHVGDDTLSDDSIRFAADDTYAAFPIGTLEEVMYSNQPAVSESSDLIVRLKVTNQQEAGLYQTQLVFISVPIF